jgi:hypothetical protein
MKNQQLLEESAAHTKKFIETANLLKTLTSAQLNWKTSTESWSILECLEHLNLYGDYYIPLIEKTIQSSTHATSPLFKSGWLGNYFAKSMLPKEKMNKMKTFKDKNPINSNLTSAIIDRFIAQQEQFLILIAQSEGKNLATRMPISISSYIRLKLGDVLQFTINHTIRHLLQVTRIQTEFEKRAKH